MSDSKLGSPHDRFAKQAFSNLEVARGFFAKSLLASVTARLDLTTLELLKESFVDSELRHSFGDLLFHVKMRDGSDGLTYLLFEHKSAPDVVAKIHDA
jgi:predicted transposase YdaD